VDPIGEILKAIGGEKMNGWGALAIGLVCAAWSFAQWLRFVHHAEERAARAPDAPPAQSSIKPPGTAGLLLLLIGVFGLAIAGGRVRERWIEARAAGAADKAAAPSPAARDCDRVTCPAPARCEAGRCVGAAKKPPIHKPESSTVTASWRDTYPDPADDRWRTARQ